MVKVVYCDCHIFFTLSIFSTFSFREQLLRNYLNSFTKRKLYEHGRRTTQFRVPPWKPDCLGAPGSYRVELIGVTPLPPIQRCDKMRRIRSSACVMWYVLEVWTRMNLAGGLSCVSLINIGGDSTLSFNSANIQHVVIFFNIFWTLKLWWVLNSRHVQCPV
jgi:hypothetical protein